MSNGRDFGPFTCDCCGKVGVKKVPTQRFCCRACSDKVNREERKHYFAQYEADRRAAAKMEQHRADHASDEGAKFDELRLEGKSLARVDAEAHAFGLTYGQYTAAIRSGGIEQLLRYKGITNWKEILQGIKTK